MELEQVRSQINQEAAQEKSKRGRPKLNQSQSQSQSLNQPQSQQHNQSVDLTQSIKVLINYSDKSLKDTYNDDNLITPENEIELISSTGNDVINSFFPNINSKIAKLLVLIIALFSVYYKKFLIISQKIKDKKEENKKKEQSTDTNIILKNN